MIEHEVFETPRVGVSVIIYHQGKILMGPRRGPHGHGRYAFPGGKVDVGEMAASAAVREVREETGLEIHNLTQLSFTDDVFPEDGFHFITLFYTAESHSPDAQLLEPEKCDGWDWFLPYLLPAPLFLPIQNLLKQMQMPSKP